MDTEHPDIAGKELSRTSANRPSGDVADIYEYSGLLTSNFLDKTAAVGTQISISRKTLKDMYLTILDRFAEEETKGLEEYEGLLNKINQTIEESAKAGNAGEVTIPLIQMRRQINRILQEERTHLDAINALKDMLQTK